jgi:O-antigen/teichoic acid export membrane protein
MGDMLGVASLYSRSTQLICVVVAPPVAILAFFSEPVLNAWTHNPAVAHHAAPILCLYAVGNGLLAISAFPYYLQSAKGDLRLHVLNNILLLVLSVPGVILAAMHYGGIGAGAVWVAVNLLCLIFWVPIVHARFFDGSHLKWLLRDVCAVVVPVALVAWIAALTVPMPAGRFMVLSILAVLGCALLMVATASSSTARALIRQRLSRRLQAAT